MKNTTEKRIMLELRILIILVVAFAFSLGLEIGIISATSISPNQIEINLSAGEQTSINLTINSDNNSVLKIISDNLNCVVVNDLYEVNKGINYRNLTFYVPADADLSNKECNFNFKFLDIEENKVYVYSRGGTRIIENKTTEYKEVPKYINQTIPINITVENTNKIDELKKDIKNKNVAIIILSSISAILLLLVFYLKWRRKANDKHYYMYI